MLNVLIVPSSPSPSPIIDSDANDASPPPFPRPFPLSDDIPQASYSRHPYSASTIPPIQYDSSSSEIPTSNGEAEFSSSQLFVQFTPPERPPVSIQSRIPIPSRPVRLFFVSHLFFPCMALQERTNETHLSCLFLPPNLIFSHLVWLSSTFST